MYLPYKLEKIKTLEELNICGIWYCRDSLKEEDRNFNDKIEKLKTNLKKWIKRRLTLEGKSLVVKTFGILQLICSLQALPLELKKSIEIERLISGFSGQVVTV